MKAMMSKLFVGVFTAVIATSAQAQDITSPDGEWRATLDANGTGQITSLFDNGGTRDNIFETLWYERSIGTGGVTARVESTYTIVGSNIGTNSAEFSMLRNDQLLELLVHVTMLDGANGGAFFDLWWTNVSSVIESVQPYAYFDIDANASAAGDFASLVAPGQLLQSDGGVDIYATDFGGLGNEWEIQTFAGLRNDLDAGRTGLTNSGGGGPADFTSALAGSFVTINPGESTHASFLLGGLPAPGSVALFALAGVTTMRRRR